METERGMQCRTVRDRHGQALRERRSNDRTSGQNVDAASRGEGQERDSSGSKQQEKEE